MPAISIIGTGYVGLVTGACLAELGYAVTGIDIDAEKIGRLQRGELPIYEPGLHELVVNNLRAGRLHFTTSYAEGLQAAEFIFIAVHTPMQTDGSADMRYVRAAAISIAQQLDHDAIIVNKSTMPVGSGNLVAEIVTKHLARPDVSFAIVANPEFLAQGNAVKDFMHPNRVVIGSANAEAARRVAQLYQPLQAPIIQTNLAAAEMIKYASNAFLATKISFMNEIARICEGLGADVTEVAKGMGADQRINPQHLQAGVGFGGSCFSKDVAALLSMAHNAGIRPALLANTLMINQEQRRLLVEKTSTLLGGLQGTVIGVLGLAFKPNTDDMRDAPAIDIVRLLIAAGAKVRAYDPIANASARSVLHDPKLTYCSNALEAAHGVDALLFLTNWDEFANLRLLPLRDSMRRPIIVDGRNIFAPRVVQEAGFTYASIGRETVRGNAHTLADSVSTIADAAADFNSHEPETTDEPLVGARH